MRSGFKPTFSIKSRATKPALERRSFLYFAQRELRLEEYLGLIEASFSDDQLQELNDSVADLTELEDRVAEESDATWQCPGGLPYHDIGAETAEIAHPKKGDVWFKEGAQENIVVHRFGRFVDP